METKEFTLESVADEGRILALFSVEGVVDRDDEMIAPGAIPDGVEVPILQWGHAKTAPPIGKGRIVRDGTSLYIDGMIFLNTAAGRDAYEVLKSLGPVQKWSFGFLVGKRWTERIDGKNVRVLADITPLEVSPVVAPAMPLTRTVAVKEVAAASPNKVKLLRLMWRHTLSRRDA